ncbi:protein FAM57B-like [Notechis scutatus]|uniref:Protein FAM57B-like n=1 Tax=Notechis scutatus TaxID=8663 RepID=A0A6J1W1T2_9SAUR|nr:protein FAM57B-like [Notechis scutatus]
MFHALVAGTIVFPGLFLLSKNSLKWLPGLRWEEADAVIVSARLVSSVQAIMASTVGYIISSSCKHIIDDQHWLTSNYTQFAVPYFIYDIYAMFLCHWHRYQVKGHESRCVETQMLHTATRAYLHKELLMVIHHLFMVLVCFPVSVLWRQGKGDFFLGCMLMAELSTPFVCLGKVLILVSITHY